MKNLVKLFGTQKGWICVVVLFLVCTGAVFAQQRTSAQQQAQVKKNAITLDIFHLMRGFIASDSDTKTFFVCIDMTYERLVTSRISIGPELEVQFGKIWDDNSIYFGLGFNGRYYPLSEQMDRLFLGASLGFNLMAIDGKIKKEHGGFIGPYVAATMGYKVHLVRNVFFIEPSLSYTYAKASEMYWGMTPWNLGWNAALRIGFSF